MTSQYFLLIIIIIMTLLGEFVSWWLWSLYISSHKVNTEIPLLCPRGNTKHGGSFRYELTERH